MSSSKFPVYVVPVPDTLIRFSQANQGVLCNLRPQQRPIPPNETLWEERYRQLVTKYFDHGWVDEPVKQFLRDLPPKSKVLLHFQGYGDQNIGTAVVEVQSVYWSDSYPRLDFEHPKKFERLHGCPNFWGAFILAIMAAPKEATIMTREDGDAGTFIRSAKAFLSELHVAPQ